MTEKQTFFDELRAAYASLNKDSKRSFAKELQHKFLKLQHVQLQCLKIARGGDVLAPEDIKELLAYYEIPGSENARKLYELSKTLQHDSENHKARLEFTKVLKAILLDQELDDPCHERKIMSAHLQESYGPDYIMRQVIEGKVYPEPYVMNALLNTLESMRRQQGSVKLISAGDMYEKWGKRFDHVDVEDEKLEGGPAKMHIFKKAPLHRPMRSKGNNKYKALTAVDRTELRGLLEDIVSLLGETGVETYKRDNSMVVKDSSGLIRGLAVTKADFNTFFRADPDSFRLWGQKHPFQNKLRGYLAAHAPEGKKEKMLKAYDTTVERACDIIFEPEPTVKLRVVGDPLKSQGTAEDVGRIPGAG